MSSITTERTLRGRVCPEIPDPVRSASVKRNFWWYLSPLAWLRKIVHLDDSPHSIALGAAIGVFIAFTPTVGIQMLIVLGIAWLCKPFFRFNRIAGLIAVYISNPVTTLPIYWFNYWVGTFFVEGNVTKEALKNALSYNGLAEWSRSLFQLTIEFGWPLVLGSVLVGLVAAAPSYPLIRWLANSVQRHRRLKELRILRQRRHQDAEDQKSTS